MLCGKAMTFSVSSAIRHAMRVESAGIVRENSAVQGIVRWCLTRVSSSVREIRFDVA